MFENCYRQIGFVKTGVIQWNIKIKKISYCLELIETQKIHDANNHKQYYRSFSKNKYNKLVNSIKTNYLTNKNYRKPKHSWHKSQLLRQVWKVLQVDGSVKILPVLYVVKRQNLNFLLRNNDYKKKKQKQNHLMLIKVFQVFIKLKFWILLILNYSLKLLNQQSQIKQTIFGLNWKRLSLWWYWC